jgi:hypothetical protein
MIVEEYCPKSHRSRFDAHLSSAMLPSAMLRERQQRAYRHVIFVDNSHPTLAREEARAAASQWHKQQPKSWLFTALPVSHTQPHRTGSRRQSNKKRVGVMNEMDVERSRLLDLGASVPQHPEEACRRSATAEERQAPLWWG